MIAKAHLVRPTLAVHFLRAEIQQFHDWFNVNWLYIDSTACSSSAALIVVNRLEKWKDSMEQMLVC